MGSDRLSGVVVSGGVVVLLGALLLVGCDEVADRLPTGEDGAIAQLAVDTVQQGSLEAALLAALTGELAFGEEAEMAAAAAEAAPGVFRPDGCVTGGAVGDSVNLVLEDCDGPYGLRGVTGGLSLVFTVSSEVAGVASTAVVLTSGGLDANGSPLGVNVSGGMDTNDEGQRIYELVTAGGGATREGDPITRAGSFGMRLEDGCLVMNGGWSATVGFSLYPSTFAGFTRCDDACPTSGTLVTGEAEDVEDEIDLDASGITVTFLGGRQVAWASTEGRAGSTTLICEERE